MSQINNTGMEDARRILRPRREDAHKGDFGHALLVCGSCGMAGAAVLATMGALRSGCGLVTVHLPESERAVIHCTCPSVMVDSDPQGHFSILPSVLEKYTAVGCGCGLGRHPETAEALSALLDAYRKPMVLDADALNIIAGAGWIHTHSSSRGAPPPDWRMDVFSGYDGEGFPPGLQDPQLPGGQGTSFGRHRSGREGVLQFHRQSGYGDRWQRGCPYGPPYRPSRLRLPGIRCGPSGSVAARQSRGYRGLALRTERYEQPGHSRLSRRGVPLSGKIFIKRLTITAIIHSLKVCFPILSYLFSGGKCNHFYSLERSLWNYC